MTGNPWAAAFLLANDVAQVVRAVSTQDPMDAAFAAFAIVGNISALKNAGKYLRGLRHGQRGTLAAKNSARARPTGAAANPTVKFRENSEIYGRAIPTRTEEEALKIANLWIPGGVPDWMNVRFADELPLPDALGHYGVRGKFMDNDLLSFTDFFGKDIHGNRKIGVVIKNEVLDSDEMIVAAIAHEIYEIGQLRTYFLGKEAKIIGNRVVEAGA